MSSDSAEHANNEHKCPACRGDVPHDLAQAIRDAQPGERMSAQEFRMWLARAYANE